MIEPRVTKRPDGTTRYRVMVDGGIHPSGVAWERVVPTDDEVANRNAEAKMYEVAGGFGYERPAPPAMQQPVSAAGKKPGRKWWEKS